MSQNQRSKKMIIQEPQKAIDNMKAFIENQIELLEKYDKEKKAEGFIPTVEMYIEDLKKSIE